MKKILLLLLILYTCIFQTSVRAEVLEGHVQTSDNVSIAYDVYKNSHDNVIILAHGWFMTKNSNAFIKMAEDFSKYYDVIVLDFRGHGESSGKYTFGSKEVEDIKPIINYATRNYKKIYLIGFSLGSLISVDYCSKNNNVDKLILVSAPTDFDKIENNVLSPNAFVPTLRKFEYKRWTSIRFSLSSLKRNKIKPINEIKKVKIPTLFIAGENDPIIYKWHNSTLFKASNSTEKKQILIKKGKHAEDLYLDAPQTFIDTCVNWLNKS